MSSPLPSSSSSSSGIDTGAAIANNSLYLSPVVTNDSTLRQSLFTVSGRSGFADNGRIRRVIRSVNGNNNQAQQSPIVASQPQPPPSFNNNIDPAMFEALAKSLANEMEKMFISVMKPILQDRRSKNGGTSSSSVHDDDKKSKEDRAIVDHSSEPKESKKPKKVNYIVMQKKRMREYVVSLNGLLKTIKIAQSEVDDAHRLCDKISANARKERKAKVFANCGKVAEDLFIPVVSLEDLVGEINGKILAVRSLINDLLSGHRAKDDDAINNCLASFDEIEEDYSTSFFHSKYLEIGVAYDEIINSVSLLPKDVRPDFGDVLKSFPIFDENDDNGEALTNDAVRENCGEKNVVDENAGEAAAVFAPLNQSIHIERALNADRAHEENKKRIEENKQPLDALSKPSVISQLSSSVCSGRDPTPPPLSPDPSDDEDDGDDNVGPDEDDEDNNDGVDDEKLAVLRQEAALAEMVRKKAAEKLEKAVITKRATVRHDRQYYQKVAEKESKTEAISKYLKDIKPSNPSKIYSEINSVKMDIYDSFADFENRLAMKTRLAEADGKRINLSEELKIHLFEPWLESAALRDIWLSRNISSMIYKIRKEYFIQTYGLKSSEVNLDYHACKWDGKENIRAFNVRLSVAEERYCRYNNTPANEAFLRTSFIEHLGDNPLRQKILKHSQTQDNMGVKLTRNDLVNQADLEHTNYLRDREERNKKYELRRQEKVKTQQARDAAINAITKSDSYGKQGDRNNNNKNNKAASIKPYQQTQIDRGCRFCQCTGHYQEICDAYYAARISQSKAPALSNGARHDPAPSPSTGSINGPSTGSINGPILKA
jgi:hypothetical protein